MQDKKVFISVSGPKGSRRRLLPIIRSVFEEIHGDITKLTPQEMVPLPDHPNLTIEYGELLVMENNGIEKFPRAVGTELIQIDVDELLNGVDLDRTKRGDTAIDGEEYPIRLFCSYSHADESFRQ